MNIEDASFDRKNFSCKFSNKEYYLELSLFNSNGDIIFIKKSQLLSLVIEDNIFNPFHQGLLLLNDDNNLLEKGPMPYTFLGNGRDILYIKIVSTPNNQYDLDINNKEVQEFLGMEFKFVIIDSKQVLYNNAVCRQLEFIEYGQYALAENICNIFGIQPPKSGIANYLNTNTGNSIPTGNVIKQILEKVFDSNDIYYKDKSGKLIFESEGNDSLIISPYGLVSYMEVLNYTMGFHSHQESPCILTFDRFQKKFALISLKTLFEENEKHVVEALYFANQTKSNGKGPIIEWDIFEKTFGESRIATFYVESPAAKHNIVYSSNGSVLSQSKETKSFIFDLQSLHSDNFTKKYYDLFVKPFENVFSKYKLNVAFNISPNIQDNYNTYKANLPPILEEKKFLNQKLMTLLYLNGTTYQFKLEGLLHRQAMTFVDIVKYSDNPEENKPTKWDNLHVGRHFVTRVKHIFTQDSYVNEIETIKPYIIEDRNSNKTNIKDVLENKLPTIKENVDVVNKTNIQNNRTNAKQPLNIARKILEYAKLGNKIQNASDDYKKTSNDSIYKSRLSQYKTDLKTLFGDKDMTDEKFNQEISKLQKNSVMRTFPFHLVKSI